MKRKLESQDLANGRIIESKKLPGKFFTVTNSESVFTGSTYSRVYTLRDEAGNYLFNKFMTISRLRAEYHKPKGC